MALINILIYALFAMVMMTLARRANRFPAGSPSSSAYICCYVLFFTLISAARWNVGVDCLSYAQEFTTGKPWHKDNAESLYVWIVQGVHDLNLHYSVGLGIMAFVQIFFIVRTLKDCRYLLFFLPVVLFGGSFFLDLSNACRQMMAAAVILYASRSIVDKRPVKYFALIWIASLFHHSAWIAAFLYVFAYIPLQNFDLRRWRLLLIAILFACLFIGFSPNFAAYAPKLEQYSEFLGYDNYSSRVKAFSSGGYTEEVLRFGPMQLSYFLTALLLTWYGPMLQARYENRIKYFHLWYILAYAYGALFFLICNVSHIFIRPVMYLELFQLVILSLLLYDLMLQRYYAKSRYAVFVVMAIICASATWNVIKSEGRPMETVTYKTVFFHKEDDELLLKKN